MHCSLHTNIHPMVGVDLHNGIIPGTPPVPTPFMPHFVSQVLGGLNLKASLATKVMSHNFITLQRGSDIGLGIGHVATNLLFPILVLASSSVSQFGSFTVHLEGKPAAIAPLVYVGFNFNCFDPAPWNTNLIVAPGCNMAGFSLADYVASMVSIALSIAVGFVCNAAFGGLTSASGAVVGRVFGKAFLTEGLEEIAQSQFGRFVQSGTEEVMKHHFGNAVDAGSSFVAHELGLQDDSFTAEATTFYTGE
ncbi:MAG: hypothetical protein ACPG6B_06130, partial [Oceanihabitans sp.]